MGCVFSYNKKERLNNYIDTCPLCGNFCDTLFRIKSMGKYNGKFICLSCLLDKNRKIESPFTCQVCGKNCEEIYRHYNMGDYKQKCLNCLI